MTRKAKIEKMKLNLLIIFVFGFLFFVRICAATPSSLPTSAELTLENLSERERIAILKLTVINQSNLDSGKGKVSCFLSQGLEITNDKNYSVNPGTYGDYSQEAMKMTGNRVIFYSGAVKGGEKKEFIFSIRIPDDRKYLVSADAGNTIVLDLGDPEPPEWNPNTYTGGQVGYKDGKIYVSTGIKEIKPVEKSPVLFIQAESVDQGMEIISQGVEKSSGLQELTIPEDALPPLRTELKIRTKEREYYKYHDEIVKKHQYDKPIPVRYLLYTEDETPNAKVTLTVPKGLEFINEDNYQVSTLTDGNQQVILYSGAMRFQQCKGFYLKFKAISRNEEFPVIVTVEINTSDGKKLVKEDKVVIDLKERVVLE